MYVYVVQGVDAHNSDILGIFANEEDAEKSRETGDADGHAFITINKFPVYEEAI